MASIEIKNLQVVPAETGQYRLSVEPGVDPDNPLVGSRMVLSEQPEKFPEAPEDGKQYARSNKDWVPVESGSPLDKFEGMIKSSQMLTVYGDVTNGIYKGIKNLKSASNGIFSFKSVGGLKTAVTNLTQYFGDNPTIREVIFPLAESGDNNAANYQESINFTVFVILNVDKVLAADGDNHTLIVEPGGSSSTFSIILSSSFQGERARAIATGVSGNAVAGNLPTDFTVFEQGINIVSIDVVTLSDTSLDIKLYVNGQLFESDTSTVTNARFSPNAVWGQATPLTCDSAFGLNAIGASNSVISQQWLYENIYNPWRELNGLAALPVP